MDAPLLHYLHTSSAILVGAHSYFVVSFKFDGKHNCHDLIPNSRWLVGTLLASRSGLVEEDAVEVFHYYGFHLSSSFLMYNFKNFQEK